MTPVQYLLGEIIIDYTHMDSADPADNYTERLVIVSINLGFTVNIRNIIQAIMHRPLSVAGVKDCNYFAHEFN